jgi:putative transcriptional regulator
MAKAKPKTKAKTSGIPSQPSWLGGQILVAMPTMQDPRFSQSVIFICAHTGEGAMGIVVNRPLQKLKLPELLRQLGIEAAPEARSIRLQAGGPVENNRGFVLHSSDWTAEDSLEVDDHYVLTASLDILRALAEGHGPARGFLAMGYASWGPGQLDDEILQNAWLTVPADEAIVFDADDSSKWIRALAKLKIDPARLSGTAGRA